MAILTASRMFIFFEGLSLRLTIGKKGIMRLSFIIVLIPILLNSFIFIFLADSL